MRLILLMIGLLLVLGCGEEKEVGGKFQPSGKKIKVPEIKEVKLKPEKEMKLKRDPFLSKEEQSKKLKGGMEKISKPVLSAIIHNPNQKFAIIDGKILKVGEVIDSKEIVEIKPESVILKEEGKLYLLELKDVVSFRKGEIAEVPSEGSDQKEEDISEEGGLSWQ